MASTPEPRPHSRLFPRLKPALSWPRTHVQQGEGMQPELLSMRLDFRFLRALNLRQVKPLTSLLDYWFVASLTTTRCLRQRHVETRIILHVGEILFACWICHLN
ncbi:uncharacterized protein J3R85_000431 [Psidium guajava]|nr:uncharacterized protein J3R85_000431 [Psidium guajava]